MKAGDPRVLAIDRAFSIVELRLMRPLGQRGPARKLSTVDRKILILVEAGVMGVAELSEQLTCSQSTASVDVEDLVKRGLIERTRDRLDNRRFLLTMTAKGTRRLLDLRENIAQALTTLGARDTAELLDALTVAVKASAALDT